MSATITSSTAAFALMGTGLLYSWGLRFFLFVAPVVVGLVDKFAMPFAAAGLVFVLRFFDRVPDSAPAGLESA